MNPSSETKQCSKCRETKKVEEFYRKYVDRYTSRCKSCSNEESRQSHERKRKGLPPPIRSHPYYKTKCIILNPPKTDRTSFKALTEHGPDMTIWEGIRLPTPIPRNRRNQPKEENGEEMQSAWGRQAIHPWNTKTKEFTEEIFEDEEL